MTSLHVREIPENTLSTLKVRAANSGQSLQAYVRQLLNREAAMLTLEEVFARAQEIADRSSVTADDVVEAIAESHRDRQ
ncbi:MAG TPA: hypothetical protein VE172_21545 [Stackebrandtia sp.]|jgi:plasmid stability protein|uniref:FitA-like ribbon-helix-helix domain-containing protein n=1 Tax=Stackebrandtia sp. TaxID=2023065 RepID=UPI002D4D4D37|nr:hypothetical protein [Stackebrandtia sp.]HZE41393.1 hypothetical protein [Stackebrandtia sp.]